MKTKWTRAARIICAMLMLVSLLIPEQTSMVPTVQAVTQEDIDNLKSDAKDLAQQQSEQKRLIAELKNDRTKAIQLRNLLDQQISTTEQAIVNTEKQIAGYEALLSQTEYELEETRRAEEETYALFCRRARAMEEEGVPSFWSVLFKATSFSDLLSRLSDVQVVIDYDQGILNDLSALKAQIEEKLVYQNSLKTAAEDAKV